MSDKLLEMAYAAAKQAQGHGADEAKVGVSRARGVDLEWRDGRLEQVMERTRSSLSAELYVEGRYSVISTNDLRPEALDAFLAEGVRMTRLLEPDPHRGLPDPKRYEGRAALDLQLADPNHGAKDSAARKQQIEALEALIRESSLPIISVSTSATDNRSESARVHTNGFEGARQSTSSALSAMVTLKDQGDRRPMGWDYTYQRFDEDLQPLSKLAAKALHRAANQLGAGALATGQYTIGVNRDAVGRLLGALLGPLFGPALQQQQSLWDGKLGAQIVSPLLSLYDDPHRPRGLGAALWDDDGFATRRRPIIERGVLSTYLIDDYYARKMGVAPTGADLHDLDWAYGDKDAAGLIKEIGEGVWIDRFLGGNHNSTTGEISLGAAGRMIRGGALAEPIAEFNLAGHFGELWSALVAVGDDPDINRSERCPTCVFEGVQLSGG
ncbi:TldD/PmbA family protein [Myxococcota bacterium]|nr:TldD/PmbA family protein [Myxococcota bacterium]MBU1430016.1 TldD/PmbA family protein [Myxococcota bacterium]MBU1899855.1 TldD/PmbA family protein [Myxococcota bacterium]